jgi:membrane-bound serine protease (ClpP class)
MCSDLISLGRVIFRTRISSLEFDSLMGMSVSRAHARRGRVLLLTFIVFLYISIKPISAENNKVIIADINGEITEATNIEISDILTLSSGLDARLVILRIDTPGGEANAVQSIMTAIEESSVPVCAFISPIGATAWSGGTYILASSDVAVMASGTSIGSAQPVLSTGTLLNDTKHINALKALMVNHSFYRGRNTTAAERFVTENLNLGPTDALRYHVIEIVADDLSSLLTKLSSKSQIKVELSSGEVQWRIVDSSQAESYSYTAKRDFSGIEAADVVRYNPSIRGYVLHFLFNPLVSTLMLILGILLLVTGLHTPGLGAELSGLILIILSLYSLQVIGVEPLTVILLVIGFTLILAELKTHIGVLAIGGLVLITIGGLLFFPSPQWLIAPEVTYGIRNTIALAMILFLGFFSFLLWKVIQVRRSRVKTGYAYIVGEEGVATTNLSPRGEVRLAGETWGAESVEERIQAGASVIVVRREGLTIYVKRKQNEVK